MTSGIGGTLAGRGDWHAIAHFLLFLVQNLHIGLFQVSINHMEVLEMVLQCELVPLVLFRKVWMK